MTKKSHFLKALVILVEVLENMNPKNLLSLCMRIQVRKGSSKGHLGKPQDIPHSAGGTASGLYCSSKGDPDL